MHKTSALYKKLIAGDHYMETRLDIAGISYYDDDLVTLKTGGGILKKEGPEIGCVISRTIETSVFISHLHGTVPERAKLEPFYRATDGAQHSEWIQKGKFYIDTRNDEAEGLKTDQLKLKGYDDMLKAEQDCPIDGLDWPASDIQVVRLIAAQMDVPVDPRTEEIIVNRYPIQLPADYSSREVLSAIAAMYGGAFLMSDEGMLQMIQLCGIPPETSYLIDSAGNPITIGGRRIIV